LFVFEGSKFYLLYESGNTASIQECTIFVMYRIYNVLFVFLTYRFCSWCESVGGEIFKVRWIPATLACIWTNWPLLRCLWCWLQCWFISYGDRV